MKELKFTPENLERHLNKSDLYICTTRDELKGNIGDVFEVKGVGVYRLDAYMRYSRQNLESLASHHCVSAGFLKSDYISELMRIYPDASEFYVHYFWRVEI